MTDITNKQWTAMSNTALISIIGSFIKYQRLEQNKTQAQLAKEAGINRATLSLFENGENSNLITFIQLLRALKLLHILHEFEVTRELSPIQLAKLERSQRIRARHTGKKVSKPNSD